MVCPSVYQSVCPSAGLCPSVALVHPAKGVGRYELPFGRDTRVVQSNTVLDRDLGSQREGIFGRSKPQSKFALQIGAKPLQIAEWLLPEVSNALSNGTIADPHMSSSSQKRTCWQRCRLVPNDFGLYYSCLKICKFLITFYLL